MLQWFPRNLLKLQLLSLYDILQWFPGNLLKLQLYLFTTYLSDLHGPAGVLTSIYSLVLSFILELAKSLHFKCLNSLLYPGFLRPAITDHKNIYTCNLPIL